MEVVYMDTQSYKCFTATVCRSETTLKSVYCSEWDTYFISTPSHAHIWTNECVWWVKVKHLPTHKLLAVEITFIKCALSQKLSKKSHHFLPYSRTRSSPLETLGTNLRVLITGGGLRVPRERYLCVIIINDLLDRGWALHSVRAKCEPSSLCYLHTHHRD